MTGGEISDIMALQRWHGDWGYDTFSNLFLIKLILSHL